jgi:hypothetical protein
MDAAPEGMQIDTESDERCKRRLTQVLVCAASRKKNIRNSHSRL